MKTIQLNIYCGPEVYKLKFCSKQTVKCVSGNSSVGSLEPTRFHEAVVWSVSNFCVEKTESLSNSKSQASAKSKRMVSSYVK